MSYITIDLEDSEKRIVYELINNADFFNLVINKIALSLSKSFANCFDLDNLSEEKTTLLAEFTKEASLNLLSDLTLDIIKDNKDLFDKIKENIGKEILKEEFDLAKKRKWRKK